MNEIIERKSEFNRIKIIKNIKEKFGESSYLKKFRKISKNILNE